MSYVIMLDKDRLAYPDDWPITSEDSSIAALRNQTQHSGNPTVVPKSGRTMERVEDKSLVDSQSGKVDAGAIYKSTKKD